MSVSSRRSKPTDTLFGRQNECQWLDGLVQDLRRGCGTAVVLTGEPGVGKTALLDYVMRRASDAMVLSARGLLSEAELSFAGLGDLVRPLLPRLGELPAPQSAALAAALAIAPPVMPSSNYAVCVATLNLLIISAEDQPILVVVDDAHWLDAPTAAALLFAARRLGADPVSVVIATRAGEPTDFDIAGFDVTQLDGLSPQAAADLLDHIRPGRVAQVVVDSLWRATGGNPLALREIGLHLDDARLGGRVPLGDSLPVGPYLEEAFRRRLDPLPADTRTALVIVALSASSDAASLVGSLASLGLDSSTLEPAEAADLLRYEDGRIVFSHPLVRSAVHQAATGSVRRRAYDALASVSDGEARAWYRAAGLTGVDDGVARELEAAAVETRRQTGFVAAARVLRRSAELTADRSLRARRLLAAATDAQMAGDMQAAASWLVEARTLATDPLLRADIDLQQGRVLTWRGTTAIAQRVLSAAASAVSDRDRHRAATLWCEATIPCAMEAHMDDAVSYARKADAILSESQHLPSAAEARMVVALSLVLGGEVADARQLLDTNRRYMDGLDPTEGQQAIMLAARSWAWIEEYDLARRMLDGVIDTARRVAAPFTLAYALTCSSDLDRWTGNWLAAYADAAEALRLAREMQNLPTIGFALACLANIEAGQGRAEQLQRHLVEMRQLSTGAGMGCVALYQGAAQGLFHLAAGAAEDAIACLESVARLVDRNGYVNPNVVPWEADLVEAYWRVGDLVQAERRLAELDERARAMGLARPHAAVARCRGLLAADGDTAEGCFREAMRLCERVSQPFERARTALMFGETLRRRRRRIEARHLLRDAQEAFQRLGAQKFEERAAAELAATGERPRRRADRSGLLQLTAQELQAALAVARGLSNPEIAAALFISRKTVEAHLSSAYRKLGLRSRTELVGYLARADPTTVADTG
jgi:DNA-binding CsgD family transcriptional regulator